jgi:HEAT repeat protein
MSIIDKLATSLSRRDEVPNQELAKELIETENNEAVAELVQNLSNRNKDIQSDCIKVLYEIGEAKPQLIATYANNFVELLDSKNNRLQWGAMTALNTIASASPDIVFGALAKLAAVADKGSVITRDNYVSILTKLCTVDTYSNDAFALLHEQFLISPTNQLPMYAENADGIIDEAHKPIFIKTLTDRLSEFDKESKRKRVEKVLKKLQGK